MSKSRKTFEVATLKERVNYYLAHSAAEHTEPRFQLASLLGGVLHDTGNYNGFRYLRSEFTDDACTKLREGYDDSRRSYF